MKNVKTLLIFITISAFVFASETRVNALGGAGFWADDVANIGAFPAEVNNHSTAWTNGENFTSIWNVDGTTWGFSGGSGDQVADMWWGNGNYGVNVGLGMTPEKKIADGDLMDADGETALNLGFGMPLANMDFGFTYGMGCDECGGGNVGINLRRSQNIWLFENILVGFNMGMEGDDAVTEPATMDLGVDCYSTTSYDNGISSLFGLGFGYGKYGDDDALMGIEWNFAVESQMTDWATLRIGYSHGYDFANGGTDVDCSADDAPDGCEDSGGLVVGLGFNYGSFNLDMNVGGYESLFTNPGHYITGRNTELGSVWTISYTW